jgi:hypothetical protein
MDIAEIQWTSQSFKGHRGDSVDIAEIQWTSRSFNGHRGDSVDIAEIQWTSPRFSGDRGDSMDIAELGGGGVHNPRDGGAGPIRAYYLIAAPAHDLLIAASPLLQRLSIECRTKKSFLVGPLFFGPLFFAWSGPTGPTGPGWSAFFSSRDACTHARVHARARACVCVRAHLHVRVRQLQLRVTVRRELQLRVRRGCIGGGGGGVRVGGRLLVQGQQGLRHVLVQELEESLYDYIYIYIYI